MGAVGRTRPWRAPADVGMMTTAAQPERRFPIHKHGRHDRDVGQMRTAIVGRVQHKRVPINRIGAQAHDRFDTVRHRPQMHRHMGRVRHKIALRIKDRTRKIQAFLDVHRPTCVSKGRTHLIGDRHEQIAHDL